MEWISKINFVSKCFPRAEMGKDWSMSVKFLNSILLALSLLFFGVGFVPAFSEESADQENSAVELKSVNLGGTDYNFCWCPPGTFMMGSIPVPEGDSGQSVPYADPDRYDDETLHQVTISKGFWILESEVTQKLWSDILGSNPSRFKGENRPVEGVSWDDCQAFIQELNACGYAPEGYRFALPTEAQWEYACRAGTTTPCSGKLWDCGHFAYYIGGDTFDVKLMKPNPWGLYDMYGNVWEWCEDGYGSYPFDSVTDPVAPSPDGRRVRRGGSWNSVSQFCRSANRNWNAHDYRDRIIGFRLCLVEK